MDIRTASLITRLEREHTLPPDGFRQLIESTGSDAAMLHESARRVSLCHHGRDVLIRGLLEVTNRCRNNCLYCGLRRDNRTLSRYALTREEIILACRDAYAAGIRTFVLQGGEGVIPVAGIAATVSEITARMPDCAVTLSLGEMSADDYAALRRAGATRYLLRHETADPGHYARLHPPEMSHQHRLECLAALKQLGFQTGAGMMVGSPGQTVSHLVADLTLLAGLRPEMVGIGPFLPHGATPFARERSGSGELTLRLISIVRLMLPDANIPATTAMATHMSGGREQAILAGANVVMPNITPAEHRSDYELYDGKASSGAEAIEGLALLERRLSGIGYRASYDRGDFKKR